MITLLLACATDPNAPPEVAFDHVACDHCSMLLSEPRHAAVLRERQGKERYFDDPGCLFTFVMEKHPAIAQMWFHTEHGFVREDEVAFSTGAHTPMGSGLLAVPVGTPGAVGVGEASTRVFSAGAR